MVLAVPYRRVPTTASHLKDAIMGVTTVVQSVRDALMELAVSFRAVQAVRNEFGSSC